MYLYTGRFRDIAQLEIPEFSLPQASLTSLSNPSSQTPIIEYKGFSLSFDEATHQAKWVAYELTDSEAKTKLASRKDNFRPDTIPGLLTGQKSDYIRSGYDRGHLAPAADMAWDQTAMDQSFFFSNISPQTPNLNRGIWKELEDKGRKWAVDHGSIYIVTGPGFKFPADSIGSLPIPAFFFKAILVYQKNKQEAIAFVMPNAKNVEGEISDYAISIDSLESIIQLDLFNKLPARIEKRIEKSFENNFWQQ